MNKKLTKSRNNRVLTGALAGIAEYFGWSPRIVRIVYFLFSVLTAHFLLGLLVYLLLMVLIPSQTTNDGFSSLFNMMQNNFGSYRSDKRNGNTSRGRKILHNVEEKDYKER